MALSLGLLFVCVWVSRPVFVSSIHGPICPRMPVTRGCVSRTEAVCECEREVWVSVAVCSVLCLRDRGRLGICMFVAGPSLSLGHWGNAAGISALTGKRCSSQGSILRATQPSRFTRAKGFPGAGFSEINLRKTQAAGLAPSGPGLGKLK